MLSGCQALLRYWVASGGPGRNVSAFMELPINGGDVDSEQSNKPVRPSQIVTVL